MSAQGTEEWLRERLGCVTASRVADVMAKTKTGWGASRANYEAQLVAERLTGEPQESFSSSAMAWGTETEPQARLAYAFRTDASVEEVGFVPHPRIEMSGASPDGLVGDEGLVEFKCPQTATHLSTLIEGKVPGKYLTQMQWQMACTGREWCDFVSYDPRLPENMALFIQRVEADADRIAELEEAVASFLWEVDAKVKYLTKHYGAPMEAAA